MARPREATKRPLFRDGRCSTNSISITAYGEKETLSLDVMVVAPQVGRIKIRVLDQFLEPLGWAEMIDGQVAGHDVKEPWPDLSAPTVSIQAPSMNARVSTSQIVLIGTAADDIAIERVEAQIGTGPFERAEGTVNWQSALTLVPGTNLIRVRAFDSSANVSSTLAWRVIFEVPSPFVALKGVYYGLFCSEGAIQPTNSGAFTLILTDKGAFTGKILLAGSSYSMKGMLDAEGRCQFQVARPKLEALDVRLHLNLNGDGGIVGDIKTSSWAATLLGDPSAGFDGKTSKAPQAGSYTLTIAGADLTMAAPFGDGYGTIIVDAKGKLTFKGTLADGTAFTQGTTISRQGRWPLYAPVNQGQGLLIGWITFAEETDTDLRGSNINWI